MDRSSFPIEIAIALLVLGGLLFVGRFVVGTHAGTTNTMVQPAAGSR
jgi:hypothetical protein